MLYSFPPHVYHFFQRIWRRVWWCDQHHGGERSISLNPLGTELPPKLRPLGKSIPNFKSTYLYEFSIFSRTDFTTFFVVFRRVWSNAEKFFFLNITKVFPKKLKSLAWRTPSQRQSWTFFRDNFRIKRAWIGQIQGCVEVANPSTERVSKVKVSRCIDSYRGANQIA